MDIQVDPTNSSTAYAVANTLSDRFGTVFKTIDAGANWTNISGYLPSVSAWSLRIHPGAGKLYLGADDGVYVTTNDGVSWRRFATGAPTQTLATAGLPHAQVFELELNPELQILATATHGRGMWEIGGVSSCDVNRDGNVNVLDVQSMVNQVLAFAPATSDVNSDGSINVIDVQIVVNAALGLGCNHP